MNRNYYAIIAGLCASTASFFGKLPSTLINSYENENLLIIGICFVLMLISNAMVWRFYVKALHNTSGTLTATLTSAATNYCLSAFLGCLIFNETTSLLWWFGTGLVLIGLMLIISEDNKEINKNK